MRTWKTVIACSILCLALWSVVPAEDEGEIDDSGDAQLQDAYEEHEKGKAAPVVPAPGAAKTEADSLVRGIRWLGHAGFLIEGDKSIYIDPYKIPEGLTPADIVLITHDHADHLSPGDLGKIIKESTVIVSVAATKDKVPKKSVFRKVEPGDTLTVGGVRIEVVPAYNVKTKFHPKDSGLVGYVVHTGGRSIYHAGDTELTPEMSKIKADVALLPVGGTYTMDAAEAAKAADAIKPKVAIPMHYGSIVGSEDDAKAFRAKCKLPVVILKVETKSEPKPAKQGEPAKKSD